MTDQSSVFNNEQAAPQDTPEQVVKPQSVDAFSDQLKAITAEDGRQKYGTVEKALEALAHSQSLIPTLQQQLTALEQEKTQLREELAKRDGLQDVVEKLSNHQQKGNEGDPSAPKFGEEDINRLVTQALEARERDSQIKSNASRVNDTLVSTFGEKAAQVVAAKAKELNTTPDALGKLAETSPDMVLALFQQKSNKATPTSSSYNVGFNKPPEEGLKRPEKSLLSGSSAKDQMEYMRKIKAEIYAKHGITE